ncbi:hypothetical protein COO60DRAFT_442525 [Scenedesmus sp. NREL 46B-D3]|nr:hypothetical protein COO60DRAFT_442525 [Scenedesmus sp. NREL 46B-D3]
MSLCYLCSLIGVVVCWLFPHAALSPAGNPCMLLESSSSIATRQHWDRLHPPGSIAEYTSFWFCCLKACGTVQPWRNRVIWLEWVI